MREKALILSCFAVVRSGMRTGTGVGWSNIQIRSDRSFPVLKFSCHRSLIAELHRQSFSAHPFSRYKNLRTEDDRSGRGRAVSVTTTSELRQREWDELNAPFLRATVDAFSNRLKACIHTNGVLLSNRRNHIPRRVSTGD
ncbi:hypothetical protein NECAME_01889 [Necator americanus]|uniref:Uncharacterized protein n=1 Tax=Necator americanus TaxID=51031 RepID=W2TN47_NECAM|nr:hypothetical protein NECAME_01889 [Necator americanus]ETN83089.1 hypothetical protein NECAME_01889 [Necator americanus]